MVGKKSLVSTIACLAISFLVISLGVVGKDQGNGLTPVEQLGKELFFDKISDPAWVSCSSCHDPKVGWTGPVAGINMQGAVYRGAVPQRFGNRKPPSAAYATQSPVFHFDEEERLFIGGNFWDGRATGEKLGNPAADQAGGPFLNPVEQHMPSKETVCAHVANSKYADLFEQAWPKVLLPLDCSGDAEIEATYERIALAIAAYEASSEVNQFSSKYDYYLAGEAELSDLEVEGLELFNGRAMCSACHPSDGEPPLFTDFSFDNLGGPKNPENPFYDMDKEFLDDGTTPINPDGMAWIDPGLGGFLTTRSEWQGMAAENMGKQKVPTLRNVDKRNGDGFPKAFTHNGFFKSLKSTVHFYNTRDIKLECSDPFTSEEDALRMNCWPAPEVPQNVNTDELGDLGLTDAEEDAIVAFLGTLSDGFDPKKMK